MTSLLSSFPKIAATRKRPNGSDVKGVWTETAPTSTSIRIVAPQPANGTDLQFLEDGERKYTHKKTWSESELLVDDVLTIAGTDYLVVSDMDYALTCLAESFDGHYKVLIRKVQ